MTGAVVIGGYVNGLDAVRALAARGIPVAVVTTQPFDIAHRSRWCVAHDSVEGLADRPEALVEVLERRAPDWRGWALYSTNDDSLAAFAEHRERLESVYRVIGPQPEAAGVLLDKQRMMAAARAAGAELPRVYGPADAATAEHPDLRFPVIVKPLAGPRFQARHGTHLFAVDDRDELRRRVAELEEERIAAEIHDVVPGADDRIYAHATYMDARGEPRGALTIRKHRQSPPFFGSARLAELVPDPPGMHELTVELLRSIGFSGPAAAEFKLDPRDGKMRFIEVNGRSLVYNRLLRRGGLDHAGIAWADVVEGSAERGAPNGWPGIWVNLHADLLYAALRQREQSLTLREFLAPYRRPLIEAVWSARDPAPFMAQWGRTARTAMRRDGTSRARGTRAAAAGSDR